jgi:hypothetical protein
MLNTTLNAEVVVAPSAMDHRSTSQLSGAVIFIDMTVLHPSFRLNAEWL